MIHRFRSIDSTNTRAKAMAKDGAPHGTTVIAQQQTQGRGRLGRHFDSPDNGGIYMSIILRPNCPPTALMHLTCAAAVIVCDSIQQVFGFRPQVKWINDLVMDGKKLGGILTELSISPHTGLVDHAIVGIGINCNRQPEDFPPELRPIACSMSMIMGRPIDKVILEEQIAHRMTHADLFDKNQLLQRYRTDCITIGKEVAVLRGDSQYHATALDIDENGALIVEHLNGDIETVDCGEVSVRGLYGYC